MHDIEAFLEQANAGFSLDRLLQELRLCDI